jgi:hypothetical protein
MPFELDQGIEGNCFRLDCIGYEWFRDTCPIHLVTQRFYVWSWKNQYLIHIPGQIWGHSPNH